MSTSETLRPPGPTGATAGDTERYVRSDLFVEKPDGVHLRAAACDRCGTLTFPVQAVCPQCQRPPTGTRDLSADGTVFSFTVVRSRPPNYYGPVPYGFGLVELPEGLLVSAMVLADDYDALRIGAPVTAQTVDVGAEGHPALSYAFRRTEEA